jgi:hypothetical protein
MTVFSLLRPVWAWPPGGVYLQRLIFGLGSTRPPDTVRALSFIHFARLVVIRRFPDHRQEAEEIREPLLMFESNYNGTFDQYIETFSEAIPGKMRAFWQTSYGFPDVKPVTAFKAYIHANEFTVNHYYSAYPEASATMVGSALKLASAHAAFRERAETLSPARFVAAYREFITAMQGDL